MMPNLLLSSLCFVYFLYFKRSDAFSQSSNTFNRFKSQTLLSRGRISFAHFSSLTPSERDLQKFYLLKENKRPEIFGIIRLQFIHAKDRDSIER